MNDNAVLQTAVGLVFIVMALSLLTMALQEFVMSHLFRGRALVLRNSLRALLEDKAIFNSVINHPLVSFGCKKPSYIPSQGFSSAIIDILGGRSRSYRALYIAALNLPQSRFKTAIGTMFRDGETDLSEVEKRLQGWFEGAMDRGSGDYKRLTQLLSLGLGTAIAILFRIDLIWIGHVLWNNAPVRDRMVEALKSYKNIPKENVVDGVQILNILKKLFADESIYHNFGIFPIWENFDHIDFSFFIGCFLAGFAASFTAPFWFDALQKLINLRGAGPVPEKAGTATSAVEGVAKALFASSHASLPLAAALAGGVVGVSGTFALSPGSTVKLEPGASVKLEQGEGLHADGKLSLDVNPNDLGKLKELFKISVDESNNTIKLVQDGVLKIVYDKNGSAVPVSLNPIQISNTKNELPKNIKNDINNNFDFGELMKEINDHLYSIDQTLGRVEVDLGHIDPFINGRGGIGAQQQ